MKLLFLLPLLVTLLHAQEKPRVICRLLDFQRDGDGDAQTLYVVDESGKATPCTLTRSTLSKPVELPLVDQTLHFRKTATEPPISSVLVPATIKEALVIFFPSNDPKQAFRAVVLDGSEKSFPKNGCLVLNLYSSDVRFVVGEHKNQLPPGKNVTLIRPEQRDNFNMVDVIFQFNTPTGWRSAYETKSRFAEGQRHLYISYVDPADERPRVRAYRD